MAESDDAQMQRTSLLGLVRTHVTVVLTLIPILLSGLRIFAVANGDRPTLVTRLSTLDVTAVLLGTFAWLLPTAFGVAALICWIRWLHLRAASPPTERRANDRRLMAGGVHNDVGAHLVRPRPGQRLVQPAPLSAGRVLLSQARAKIA